MALLRQQPGWQSPAKKKTIEKHMTILQETFVTPSPSTIWDGVPSRRSSCRNNMFFTVHQWEFRFGSVCRHSDAESTQALLKVGSWVVIVTIGLLLKGGNVRRQGFQVEILEVSSLLRRCLSGKGIAWNHVAWRWMKYVSLLLAV